MCKSSGNATEEQSKLISIQINETKRDYILVETTAPVSYDGFGTFTIYKENPASLTRQVLIDSEYLNWQESRYMSGGHSILNKRLWKRITGANDSE